MHLGISQNDSRRAFAESPTRFEKVVGSGTFVDAYFESTFQVFFSKANGLVEYIELSRNPNFIVSLDKLNIFSIPANELIDQISKVRGSEFVSDDGGYSYLFRSLELSLWRPVLPGDLNDEGHYFETVGIGVPGFAATAV